MGILTFVLVGALTGPRPSHDTTVSFGRLTTDGAEQRLELRFDADRMLQTAAFDDPDGTLWSAVQLEQARAAVDRYVREHYTVLAGEEPLPLELREYLGLEQLDPLLGAERLVELRLVYTAPMPPGDFLVTFRHRLFVESEVGHPHALTVAWDEDHPWQQDLYVDQSLSYPWEDPSAAGLRRRWMVYAREGLWNTARSPAFLLFLPLVLVGLAGLRSMLLVALCFLVGRTLPLWLVGLEVIRPSPGAVRLALWLSLGYVLLEAWWSKDTRLRWATAALLGIVFGLALGLQYLEFGPPLGHRPLCLLGYQVGAEVVFAGSLGVGAGAAIALGRWRRQRARVPGSTDPPD